MALVQTKWPADIVHVHARLTPDNQRAQKVPFVVPGNQMYLPMARIDFREQLVAVPVSFTILGMLA